jgi:hypothetical protein
MIIFVVNRNAWDDMVLLIVRHPATTPSFRDDHSSLTEPSVFESRSAAAFDENALCLGESKAME